MKRISTSPLIIESGDHGMVVLYRYGVTVFFNMEALEIKAFVDVFSPYIIDSFDTPESEISKLLSRPEQVEGLDGENIILQSFYLPRLQVVADILAKSVVLAHYESYLAGQFDRIEPMARNLSVGRGFGQNNKELLKHIGTSLLVESKRIGRVEVLEKPEIVWKYPQHDVLYLKLSDYYELRERHRAIELSSESFHLFHEPRRLYSIPCKHSVPCA